MMPSSFSHFRYQCRLINIEILNELTEIIHQLVYHIFVPAFDNYRCSGDVPLSTSTELWLTSSLYLQMMHAVCEQLILLRNIYYTNALPMWVLWTSRVYIVSPQNYMFRTTRPKALVVKVHIQTEAAEILFMMGPIETPHSLTTPPINWVFPRETPISNTQIST